MLIVSIFFLAVKLPIITDDLIQGLDEVFPNRHPDLSLTDREVWYKAGQRFVVDYLVEQQKRQRETMLTEKVLD
tara:strand:- start:15775 stop:15996 length:222 start_codon:yes stop_codon:yes gene_type:complete